MYFFMNSTSKTEPRIINNTFNSFCSEKCLKEVSHADATFRFRSNFAFILRPVKFLLAFEEELILVDWKSKTKAKAAKIGKEIEKTGGGPANYIPLSDLENRLIEIMGKKAIDGDEVPEMGFGKAADGRLKCSCGEDTSIFDWIWQDQQSNNVRMSDGGKEVLFHPVYSSGTAAIRGQFPFQQNYHYYWEVKIISKLYGTDVMVGVGTSKIVFEDWQFTFCSLLGNDSESWGYSYHGHIQHNKLKGKYGVPFGLGSIVGVHLDMCNGTLEYFLNRKSLGIAFKDLKGKELYPMVCSTAAQSSVRIICCMSKEPTLQMMSLKSIMDHPGLYKEYKNIPGLSRIYDKQLLWIQPQVSKDEKKRTAELDEDVTLSLVDRSYLVKNKKHRAFRLISFLYGDELEKVGNDSNFEVYDICEFDLSAIKKPQIDESDMPSTSGNSARALNSAKEGKTVSLCLLCLSTTHESKNCTLQRNDDDSDSDNETAELSKIL